MSELSADLPTTLAEYLAWEEQQEEFHEFVGGRVQAMSGATLRHSLMKDHLCWLLTPGARRQGCRAFGEGRKLRVPAGSVYYPDAFVVCRPRRDNLYELDATLVVEVLSPSTRGTDRREKVSAYGELASIEQYLLVEPDIRRIEVVTWPGGEPAWATLGPDDELVTRYGRWDIAAIYDEVDREP